MNKEFLEGFQDALNRAKPGYRAVLPAQSDRLDSIRDFATGTVSHIASLRVATGPPESNLDDEFEFFTGKTMSEPSSASADTGPAARIVPIEPDASATDRQKPFPEGAVYDPKINKITGWKG